MNKLLTFLIFLLTFFVFGSVAVAREPAFVSIVNPVRGTDFWDLKNQDPKDAVLGEAEILNRFNLPATWLLRFDALNDQKIVEVLKERSIDEKGLFLEVTPTLTDAARVIYRKSQNWHDAGSAFLTGYERDERIKLIDAAFEKFKKVFGVYPSSVGAWWVDSFSLDYMVARYGIASALIVSDQYSTDNYQIWGQYFATPYYPSKKNALHPAQTVVNKLDVVMMQWALRDPVNSYGNGVMESTFSIQANDYLDYHNLDTKYFSSLLDLYTKQPLNQFAHLVVGLENSYSFEKYQAEYQNQMKILSAKESTQELAILNMKDFASWYKGRFPDFSPPQIIVADDPLGTFKKAVWFMNPYFRVGWFLNSDGSVIRDLRQYIDGEEELCFQARCDSVNFATSATRVLDEVSFGHKLIIDQGKISDFKITKEGGNFVISYKNEALNQRKIEFLPRDLEIDGKISSIDGAILDVTKHQLDQQKNRVDLAKGSFSFSFQSVIFNTLKFLGFLIIGCLIPGFLLINKIYSREISTLQKIFLSLILGFTSLTLLFYVLSLIKLKEGIFIYFLVNILLLLKIRKQIFSKFDLKFRDKFNLILISLIGAGTLFQQLPVFKNGLQFPYGLGFWGPNTHDGLWHVSLIDQLIKSTPPQNPILAGETLKNYHYFYDLVIAVTSFVTGIPVLDLLFRFYPIVFSALLGTGTYYLVKSVFRIQNNLQGKLAVLFSLYCIYFAGSFGWIVEFIKFRHLGGESAFWANQSISFNLNPPFAISLLLVIAIFLILFNMKLTKTSLFVLTLLSGTLIAFKAYGGVLILTTFLIVGLWKRSLSYLVIFATSALLSAMLFFSNFSLNQKFIIFSPFWFIHSMIDSPDRVGWIRLSLARTVGWESGNWYKFLVAELLSFLIFLVGNLGTRVFALLYLFKIKHIVRRPDYVFLFVFSLLSFATAVFFIQAGNPWNTIQFIYYFLYVSAIAGGVVLSGIITKINKFLAFLIALSFLIITPINSWATANGYLSYQPHALVTSQELQGLDFLKAQPQGVVLTIPYDAKLKNKLVEPWPLFVYDSTSYVSALSSKPVFVEDEPQNQILLTDYKKRLVASKDFFQKPLPLTRFLQDNHIGYIYMQKMFNIRLDESGGNFKNIFENGEVVIYKVQNL